MQRFREIVRGNILPLFYIDTFGNIAIASLIICAVSGILLAVLYDVNSPYESLSKILMVSSSGTFYRNLHYWSAQFFLIFTLLHIWDHLKKQTEDKIKQGVWLRLSISIAAIFFVMLSGFILKADADSLQAFLILQSLIQTIPLIGNLLAEFFLGRGNDLQLIYVHHIATATIFLIMITFEHARTIWTKIPTFIYTLFHTIIFSLLLTPVLHDSLSTIIKGPWYFLGLQEILHWTSNPLYTITALFVLAIVFYFIPKIEMHKRRIIKGSFITIMIVYFLLTIFAFYFRGENWELVYPWDNPKTNYFQTGLIDLNKSFPSDTVKEFSSSLNRIEGCLTCHKKMKGFTPSHDPIAIGCSSCHSGNPFTFDKGEAHFDMVLIPGNEKDYRRSCGTSECHPSITHRLPNSIMSTLSGMISVNKYVFEETTSLDLYFNVKELGQSAAENHLRNLCVSCHIGNEKIDLGPNTELSRGGGCNACHLNYSSEANQNLVRYLTDKSHDTFPTIHPSLSLNITNDHCFGCHSRSGRISTNYEGWHETKLEQLEIKDTSGYRILEDGRVFEFIEADVHHKAGMDCVDCHNSYETMGDGNLYLHKEGQVKIQCTDCHSKDYSNTLTADELDQESANIFKLRGSFKSDNKFIRIENSGYPLLNTSVEENNKASLITKNSMKNLILNPPANICIEGSAHSDLSCNSCHSKWVPQCVGCHTDYDANSPSFDLLDNKEISGEWIEHIGEFFAELPTLGIREVTDSNGTTHRSVLTFTPGMIMTVDKSRFTKNNSEMIFKRFFSPISPHTTVKRVRNCKSCHNSSLALGFGRGKLEYITDTKFGRWKFIPRYSPIEYDNLPEDAWLGFLQHRSEQSATRTNHRPFSVEEQQNILTVGACLTCHEENSSIMLNSLHSYSIMLKNLSDACKLPLWK